MTNYEKASKQLGILDVRDARRKAGRHAIAHLRMTGEVVALTPAVARFAAAPVTIDQCLLAAILDVGSGAVASHTTAAWLWRLPGHASTPTHVIGRRDHLHRTTPYLADMVHEPRKLLDGHVREVRGIPVTTPTRTIFDLAGLPGIHPLRVEKSLDRAMTAGIVSLASLDRMLRELAKRGRPGIRLMRELIEARRKGWRPPESNLEARVQELMQRALVGQFERQVDVGDEDGWVGRMDFRHHDLRWVVEADSELWHGGLSDQRRDEERRDRLREAGWTVTAVTDVAAFHRPDEVVGTLRADFRHARKRSGSTDAGHDRQLPSQNNE